MPEIPPITPSSKPSLRKACLQDFLDDTNIKDTSYNSYNKNNSHNDTIAKHQQEFGHKKRIKP